MRGGLLRPRSRLFALFLGASLIGTLSGIAVASGPSSTLSDEPRPEIGGWPEDKDGDGVISDTGDERIPELIQAVGDKGIRGYVRLADLEGPQPSTPEEAVRMSGQARVIAVYADDGKTILDQYTISSGVEESESPSPSP